MARFNSDMESSAARHQSNLTAQPWKAMQWFWQFSLFYGRYIPTTHLDKQRLVQKSL